mmetsp:Transcript_1899/g.5565  ORF Transcript_1899/g.5565 Transcript_1899/m.5565 type:complete len:258 (+) Transcript_1899:3762-4535(+)
MRHSDIADAISVSVAMAEPLRGSLRGRIHVSPRGIIAALGTHCLRHIRSVHLHFRCRCRCRCRCRNRIRCCCCCYCFRSCGCGCCWRCTFRLYERSMLQVGGQQVLKRAHVIKERPLSLTALQHPPVPGSQPEITCLGTVKVVACAHAATVAAATASAANDVGVMVAAMSPYLEACSTTSSGPAKQPAPMGRSGAFLLLESGGPAPAVQGSRHGGPERFLMCCVLQGSPHRPTHPPSLLHRQAPLDCGCMVVRQQLR